MSGMIDKQSAIDIIIDGCGEWKGIAGRIVKEINELPVKTEKPQYFCCPYCGSYTVIAGDREINDGALVYTLLRMEEKLRECMTEKGYAEFSANIAKEALKIEMEDMEEGSFKDFVMSNFDKIAEDKTNLET